MHVRYASRPMLKSAASWTAALCLAAVCGAGEPMNSPAIQIGLAGYIASSLEGRAPLEDRLPQAIYRTGAAAQQAAPTNQWYSSVMFGRWSYPIYAQPMTYRAGSGGFELGLPDRRAVSPDPYQREIRYAHRAAITVAPLGFAARDARLKSFSDWLAQFSLASANGKALDATVLHGSPFAYFECSEGDVRFTLRSRATPIVDPRRRGADPRVVALSIDGHSYALFGPTGAHWLWRSPQELRLRLPHNARYFSVAGLPDSRPATVAAFLSVAYAFPTDTRVEWHYDEHTSIVRTNFHIATTAREGSNLATFMGLYPHQWWAAVPRQTALYQYESVRGPLRVIAGNDFTIEFTYHGIVPMWAGLESSEHRDALAPLIARDTEQAADLFTQQPGDGTYWYGKAIGASAQLLCVAEAEGDSTAGEQLLQGLKSRLEFWFDGRHAGHFVQDETLGTFIGLPQEFYSVRHMNDHHFHYGYWLMGAAHIALRDPAWASQEHWGGIVAKLIADIATEERGRQDFPFLRNFDAYESHSWAAGDSIWVAIARYGNNEESSSEAINAWAAIILWGEATNNRRLRDLGIYLYTSEVAAIEQYWFDTNHQVLGSDFRKPFATQVFGGKFAYNTWWTAEPHEIYGINLLPLTPASTYLGTDPAVVRAAFETLPAEEQRYRSPSRDDTPERLREIWQDALASYLALADPTAGLARWNPTGAVEGGETRSHTLYWLLSLSEMGTPDLSITGNTALYSVFRDSNGVRTYLAYNASDESRQVLFSNGKTLTIPPHALARAH
jgi:endoglucanase Acf2